MKELLLWSFLLLASVTGVFGQDSIRYRILFIGDAGEINPEQSTIIPAAADHILPGKTTVVYLGDNIYPHGMGLPGSTEEEQTRKILQSQFVPMRSKGAPVYFIPGNHDWDRMGRQGLLKIKQQWAYLNAQQDSLLRMVPPDGCPDPVEISVSDKMTIIAFDSEWWLFPFSKDNPDADCECSTEKEVLGKMDALLFKNRNKVILLASHHPFQSYGTHGGYYSWKDHLFPFTALNKDLYIPLPVIGSLYPLLRNSVFQSPEDLRNPLYKSMINQVDQVFDGFPNLVHVAGHEHGLQFIKDDQVQIISGAGAKHTFAKKGRYSLFADATGGVVTVDQTTGGDVHITYYTYSGKEGASGNGVITKGDTTKGITIAFEYTKKYTPLAATNFFNALPIRSDSVLATANPAYGRVGRFHRRLFGENFRKEWGAPTLLPVIRVSEFRGGLVPLQRGGGMQSTSLRLVDKTGQEWVIRSVNKNPDPILPDALRQTFARDFLDDATSGQHPYSALIVPPIADAVKVPHANPVIGIVAADTALGGYNRLFANTLCLVEEREPMAKSDNTGKMIRNLEKDNDNSFDAREFLRARMLDMLLGDWDRHEDQWRWKDEDKKKNKLYIAVPRDRDQVLHLTEGILPIAASQDWVLPTLQGFGGKINNVKYSLFKTRFLDAYTESQLSREQWKAIADEFVKDVTDSVLEEALRRLPASSYKLRHDWLLKALKERRDHIPAAMDEFYRFINRIVDIRTSDKSEWVQISDRPGNALNVTIRKINKDGKTRGVLMDKTYPADLTREIRIYTGGGSDSVVVNNKTSSIRLRIIGGEGSKAYNIEASARNVRLYDKKDSGVYYGDTQRLKRHLSKDTSNTSFVPVNLYNVTMPLLALGYNADDGIMFGAGFRHIHQYGFRKKPYTSVQELQVLHSFATEAFKVKYRGEWLNAIGKADFVLDAKALAPDNTQNFFGVGNATEFDKTGDYKRYYRARFAIYQADPALRWRSGKDISFSVGPSIQYYHFNADDNEDRFIENVSEIHAYDSATIADDKAFAGLIANLTVDSRNSKILPVSGGYFNIKMIGYSGLNVYSKSFVQVLPEMAIYKGIDRQSNVVISDRVGGGITGGKTAFYQSLFLGGEGNLYGYRQFRFAGQYMLFNNLEARIKVAQVGSYILPGQLGLIGFYDAGKVWADGYNSSTIHTGIGGGLYFAPAQLVVLQLVAGHSVEGWYPYFTMGFRF